VSKLGIAVRHPPTWSRYTEGRVTVWEAKTQTGGRGIDEVGVAHVSAAPATSSLDEFARSFFAGVAALKIGTATGDERQADLALTYTRTGAPVRVALHAERSPRHVSVMLARTSATPADAAPKLLEQFRTGITSIP